MSKHSKSSKGLNQLKNLIRGSKYPIAQIAINRDKIRLADLRALASWFSNLYQNNRSVLHGQFPRRIGDFRRQGVLNPVSIEREIIWAGELIKQHSSSIKSFIGLARKYEVHLMRGDYSVCTALLDQIENQFGVSFWGLENRIALLQVSEGLEKQKQYAAKIKEARSRNDVVAFTVFHLSHRNEDSATPGRFIGELRDRLEGWGVDKDLQAFLLFRLCDLGPNDETQFGDILRLEATSAIIDYYETFIRLSQRALSSGNLAIFRLFIQDLTVLAPLTEDTRINKMLFISDIPGPWLGASPIRNLSAMSLLVNERYQEAMELAEMLQATDEKDSNHWLTNVAASAALGLNLHRDETRLSAKITNMAQSVISKAGDIRDAEIGLSKHILNFRLMNFSFMLELFLAQEQSADPRPNTSTALLAFINSPFLDPEIIQHLPSLSQRESYSALLIERYGLTSVIALEFRRAGRVSEALPHTNSPTEGQADLERLINEKAYSQALIKARELGEARQFRIRRIANRAECHCLLSLQSTEELIDLIVARCLDDPGMLKLLPIRKAAEALDKATRAKLAGKLSTPILLDLYSRVVDDKLDKAKAYAYEDFLIYQNLDRPSKLSDTYVFFERKQLVYYLRFVCTPTVMQSSCVFDGTRDLEDERLAVLSLLVQIDPENSNDYRTEIRDITRNQMIRQGVRQVEQSKIFVNVPIIRKWAENNLRESFNRYQALVKAGSGIDHSAFEEAFRNLLAGMPPSKELLEVPKNEAMDLLIQLIQALFRECTLNPEHGLDSYLSMRIRHGTLRGQLRMPLERERIITQRESGSKDYKPNMYWIEAHSHLPYDLQYRIDERLAKFSKDCDSFIDRIAKDLIQIRSNDKQQGLFDIVLTSVGAWYLVSQTKEITDFDNFMDLCFDLFWASVEEQCLKNVRQVIDNDLKRDINSLFDALAADIDGLTKDVPALHSAIRTGQTGAQQALDRVKAWFQLSQSLGNPKLSFDHLVDIGLECVKTIHRDFDPILARNIPDLPQIISLPVVADIFIIIFDNIWRHSGVERPKVFVSVANLGSHFRIIIENEVALAVRTDEVEAKVMRIKTSILERAYKTAVRSEGGTGFIKLRKIIGEDTRELPRMDFGFKGNDRFFVDLELSIMEISDEVSHRGR